MSDEQTEQTITISPQPIGGTFTLHAGGKSRTFNYDAPWSEVWEFLPDSVKRLILANNEQAALDDPALD